MVHKSFFDILSRDDFLEVAAKCSRVASYSCRQSVDGIGLGSERVPLTDDVVYTCLSLFGKRVGILDLHTFVIERNFMPNTVIKESEWNSLLLNFKESAIASLRIALSQGLIRPKEKSSQDREELGYRHYFAFQVATNLQFETLDKGMIRRERSDWVHKGIDAEVAKISNVRLASKENRTKTEFINGNFLAHYSNADDVSRILKKYQRLVFEFDGSDTLRTTPALLGGVHTYFPEVEKSLPATAKISFIEPVIANVTESTLEELSWILGRPALKEGELQSFFEKNPALLVDNPNYRVYPQLVLHRGDGSTLRPDFFLEPLKPGLNDTATILDLKLPSERLVLDQQNRERFYAKIYEYIAQLRRYRDYFDDPVNRQTVERRYGIRALRPRIVLIVGKDYESRDYSLMSQILGTAAPVEIKTYDQILAFGRTLIQKD